MILRIGVGGATCKDVRNGATQAAAAFGPSWVVLVCGENDLWGKSVAATINRFKGVVAKYAGTGARVLYLSTKPEPATTSLHDKYQEYDSAIKAHAAELAGATGAPPPLVVVDSYGGFEDVGNPSSGSSSFQNSYVTGTVIKQGLGGGNVGFMVAIIPLVMVA